MESISHALWGMTIIREPSLWPYVAVASNLPDFLGASPHWAYLVKHLGGAYFKGGFPAAGTAFKNQSFPKWFYTVYRSTHNIFTWGLFTLLLFLFSPSYIILSVAWLSHILVDIPTHGGEWATRLFFPVSDFHFEGKNWVNNKGVIIVNFLLLLAVNILLLLR